MGTALDTAHAGALADADALPDALTDGTLEVDTTGEALDEPTAAGSFATPSLLVVAHANGSAAPKASWIAVCAARDRRGSVIVAAFRTGKSTRQNGQRGSSVRT